MAFWVLGQLSATLVYVSTGLATLSWRTATTPSTAVYHPFAKHAAVDLPSTGVDHVDRRRPASTSRVDHDAHALASTCVYLASTWRRHSVYSVYPGLSLSSSTVCRYAGTRGTCGVQHTCTGTCAVPVVILL